MDSLQFSDQFKAIALNLVTGTLVGDLVNEMHLRIMGMDGGFNDWVYFRAARFAAIDYLRSRKVSDSYGKKFVHYPFEKACRFLPMDAPELSLMAELEQAREWFTAREWRILVLYYVHGYTQAEIGEMIGKTRSLVSKVLNECRRRTSISKSQGRHDDISS